MAVISNESSIVETNDGAAVEHGALTPAERRKPARSPPNGEPQFPIVAIGASAGGLEAATKLLAALPVRTGMAFILVQHLDPTHESMMVDLLANHTAMTVVQACDATLLEPEHLYVIPPGRYLSVRGGVIQLSNPQAKHGARLPFDFLIKSLAEDCGPRSVCVVLSGSGSDGSLGVSLLKDRGGLILAQDPDEADFDGMPRSAIETGKVDFVLPIGKMPAVLAKFGRRNAVSSRRSRKPVVSGLSEIIALLREKTPHDFRLYKPGTLERRIERRMGLLGMEPSQLDHYLKLLRSNSRECDLLAKDLLINVTSFFRDTKVFDHLEKNVIPDLIAGVVEHGVLRVWVAGCSTGEEAYSLAMICRDGIAAARRNIKLQVFASDVDPDAIATARDGLYPASIASDVSPDRLIRYFVNDDGGFRISPTLRGDVIFTVQDLLGDPPFSRIDFVSCRNLLIYLSAEAQAKVMSLFHFALRERGILLLGSSETAGNSNGSFELIAKAEKVYRHIARSRIGDPGFPLNFGETASKLAASSNEVLPSRQTSLAELCRRTVLEMHAPAAVLIDGKHQCLYTLGPIDRYLRVSPGYPSHDLLTMAAPSLRTKLRLAIEKAGKDTPQVSAGRSRVDRGGITIWFSIDVQYLTAEGEDLLLVCFIEEHAPEVLPNTSDARGDAARITELEQELAATQAELQTALQNQEMSRQEQKAIDDEVLSVNEEFQSTNEELLTSKEELQSLNEELTALNSQLQETLERQRTTSDDLQNVLYSTNVATLFLDRELKIRFFTPATKSLFSVIPGDIGRPLADLHSLADDRDLLGDARAVLAERESIEREIAGPEDIWFLRRIFPYLSHDNVIEGVVITFADITERKMISEALDAARQQADSANMAKSRFLAAASHDLRQPLQSLTLIQALLAQVVEDARGKALVNRFDETLGAMSGMLNALLDINQIDAGVVNAKPVIFPIGELLDRLRDEFTYLAQSRNLSLHIMPSAALIESDPQMLEQMIRNLLANALKYTRNGKILMGCRRRGETLRIEIWDSGIGIAGNQLSAIFDEFHQVDNAARERSQGLGLGLSIVQRLGQLLGHKVKVRSVPGRGSVFSIDVLSARRRISSRLLQSSDAEVGAENQTHYRCEIVVIDDDPDVLDLLEQLLKAEGHIVRTASDGRSALALVSGGAVRPEIILADYNLPNGMTGLQSLGALRTLLGYRLPGIILTGDISTETMSEIALQDCTQLSKPVKPSELNAVIERLLPHDSPRTDSTPVSGVAPSPVTFVIEDDAEIRVSICDVLEADGQFVEDFGTAEAFLASYRPGREGCLLTDVGLPGMSGVALLRQLRQQGDRLPTILLTGSGDIGIAVEAMKAGACDFIEKPVGRSELLACISRALHQSRDINRTYDSEQAAARHVDELTARQRQVMDMVLAGHPSKNIAADLDISQRTVENHRAAVMRKMGAKSLPELARLALAAASHGAGEAILLDMQSS